MDASQQMSPEIAVEVRGLSVEFPTANGPARAVTDVSLSVARGERLAIVGESGSGKSVLSLALMGIVGGSGTITGGEVWLQGQDLLALRPEQLRRARGRDIAMVFQDPGTSLNPVISIEAQIVAPLRRHLGLSRAAARERALQLLAETGLPDPARTLAAFPHQLSGGMRQRVMIAMAVACEPTVLLADEPTTALDVTIQAQIVDLLSRLSSERGSAVVFVTHDMGLVARFADRIAVMYAGRIVESGPVLDVFAAPQHPYTRGLLASIPAVDGPLPDRLTQIDGSPPPLTELPAGCAFVDRCPSALPQCSSSQPALTERRPGQVAACWATATIDVSHREAVSA
ncbi:ABC transporter ATP-binding protein [Pseudactinotalea terrae]|uniref:ABC transporter ATP-binding protein n=1 Tax=Pseudactinotalea terrae TaxID=1743262 RepID=UPI0019D54E5C|nr:ABC transporter ATP-binding protein [Pseudactinotalea terrae]